MTFNSMKNLTKPLMKIALKIHLGRFAVALALVASMSAGVASAQISAGAASAAKSYGLGQLVAAAKRADPNSTLPSQIEHILAGLSMATSPVTTLEAIYPGSLAAGAISQLLERHGADISRMSYNQRKVFIGGIYDDPSIIPTQRVAAPLNKGNALCRKMIVLSDFSYCKTLVSRVQRCSAVKNLSKRNIGYCNEDLKHFYELMEFEGKTKLVREAGAVGGRELKKLVSRVGASSVPRVSESKPLVQREFIDCPRVKFPFESEDSNANGKVFYGSTRCSYRTGDRNGNSDRVPMWIDVKWTTNPKSRCFPAAWNKLSGDDWYYFTHSAGNIRVRFLEGRGQYDFSPSERATIAKQLFTTLAPMSATCMK